MKIFIPIKLRSTGGSSSFAKKLQRGLHAKGHQATFGFCRDFDILLVNASCPLKYLLYAKLKRIPIIQRLDGIYYPTTVAGKKYLLYNLPIQITNLFFANFAIYQSFYSKRSCAKFIGINRFIHHQVIYNGVDTNHFNPHGNKISFKDFPEQPVFITASRFRRDDQIIPLIKSFDLYQNKYKQNAKFVVIGNFEGKVKSLPNKFAANNSIKFIDAIDNALLPDYLRSADVFLFSHLNPPCPNNIIEAMSCGLPICGVADGAMPELTEKGINSELLPIHDDAYFSTRPFNHDLFADNLNKIMNNRTTYARHSRTMAVTRFTLRRMVDQYLSVLTNLQARA